jgi:glutamate-5-semialdehyde dehydrogenase
MQINLIGSFNMKDFLQKAKQASKIVATLQGDRRKTVLNAMAAALRSNTKTIVAENSKDLLYAKENDLSSALLDRLLLDEARIDAMAISLEDIALLRDPIGRILEGWTNDNGLKMQKISIPIGVIGVIYESRPNVTSDVAGLCFKSGNVAILKGGKEAINSNLIIATTLQDVLEAHDLPREAVAMIPDTSREGVSKLIKEDAYLDLIIPRGGEALIRYVNENATVPVVKHDKGLCHIFVEKSADFEMADSIIVNAKTQRPGVCNALETLLVDNAIASEYLPRIKKVLEGHGTKLIGCEATQKVIDIIAATEEDWHTEYLENTLSIKVIADTQSAITHIDTYGSGHSDAILTSNMVASELFMDSVDSACVYVNASTRFTDGAAFGFGAEVGISTNKLHSRGPMGINDLTTYKFKVFGNGHIR